VAPGQVFFVVLQYLSVTFPSLQSRPHQPQSVSVLPQNRPVC